MDLEVGKTKIKVPEYLVSGEGQPFGSQMVVFLPCVQLVEGGEEALLGLFMWQKGLRKLSRVSFRRALTPLVRAPPSWPKPPNIITLGLGFQYMNFMGDTNNQYITALSRVYISCNRKPLTGFYYKSDMFIDQVRFVTTQSSHFAASFRICLAKEF